MTILEKINNGIKLSESEISDMLWDSEEFTYVSEETGDKHRWVENVSTIVQANDGRYFEVDWYRGLTEMQENEFYEQPYEVTKHEYDRMIHVVEWVPKKS